MVQLKEEDSNSEKISFGRKVISEDFNEYKELEQILESHRLLTQKNSVKNSQDEYFEKIASKNEDLIPNLNDENMENNINTNKTSKDLVLTKTSEFIKSVQNTKDFEEGQKKNYLKLLFFLHSKTMQVVLNL